MPTRSLVFGKQSVDTHIPKDRNCEICQRTKIERSPCRRRIGGAVPRAENFGDLITADHKVLSEGCESRNNHRYAVVVQDLATQWIQSYRAKQKLLKKRRGACKSSWCRVGILVIYTDNSLEFTKACEDISWNLCTSTPNRSETNGIAERAVHKVKRRHLSRIVAIRWNLVGTFHGMLHLSAKRHRSLVWWKRHHIKDVLDNHLKDKSLLLVHWLSIILFLRKTSQEPINLERKSYLDCSLDTLCTRLAFGRVTCRLQTLSWKTMDAPEIYSKRFNAKEVIFPKNQIPVLDGRSKLPGGDQELRTHTSTRERPIRGENHVDFLEEAEGSPLSHLKTHFRMTVNRYMIFGRCQKTSFTAITLNPESNLTRREKNHFLFHWNTQTWMLCKNVALMISGTSMGQELCQIHGQVSLKLLYWKKTSRKINVVQVEIDKKAVNMQSRSLMDRAMGETGKKCRAEGVAKVVTWKTKTR